MTWKGSNISSDGRQKIYQILHTIRYSCLFNHLIGKLTLTAYLVHGVHHRMDELGEHAMRSLTWFIVSATKWMNLVNMLWDHSPGSWCPPQNGWTRRTYCEILCTTRQWTSGYCWCHCCKPETQSYKSGLTNSKWAVNHIQVIYACQEAHKLLNSINHLTHTQNIYII